MQVTVQVFGGLTEAVGGSRVEVEVPDGGSVEDLLRVVAADHPRVTPLLGSVNVAVDLEVVGHDTVLTGTEEIALLPPVAGGSGADHDTPPIVVTGLREPPFDVEATVARISGPSVGATAVFLGTVRDHAPDLEDVVALEYSAYVAMANKRLAEIARALADDHPAVTGIALLHATGRLLVGDQTVLIVCAAAHHAEAFDACRDALGRVKTQLPVFKREITADGNGRWVGLPPGTNPGTNPGTDPSTDHGDHQ